MLNKTSSLTYCGIKFEVKLNCLRRFINWVGDCSISCDSGPVSPWFMTAISPHHHPGETAGQPAEGCGQPQAQLQEETLTRQTNSPPGHQHQQGGILEWLSGLSLRVCWHQPTPATTTTTAAKFEDMAPATPGPGIGLWVDKNIQLRPEQEVVWHFLISQLTRCGQRIVWILWMWWPTQFSRPEPTVSSEDIVQENQTTTYSVMPHHNFSELTEAVPWGTLELL